MIVWQDIIKGELVIAGEERYGQKKDSKELVVKQHEEILNIIKNKEKDKVENVINYHMRDSRKSWEYLTKLDEENSKYFKRNEEK